MSNYVDDVVWLDEASSTNDYLAIIARSRSKEWLTIAARFQSKGKGRLGRSWTSRRDDGLTFSILLHPGIQQSFAGLVPLAVATGAASQIADLSGQPVEIRWPNDLIMNGRKVGGILCEVQSQFPHLTVVAGLGINIMGQYFPANFRTPATSLQQESGREFGMHETLRMCRAGIIREIEALKKGDLEGCRARFIEKCSFVGKVVSFIYGPGSHPLEATVVGIGPDGGIQLQTEGQMLVAHAGEITICR